MSDKNAESVRCPTCGSPEPMFARNLYRKGEFWGVCHDPFHPEGAASPGRAAQIVGSGGTGATE